MPSKTLIKLEEDGVEENQPAVVGGEQNMIRLLHPPRESRIRLKWDDRLEQLKVFKTKHGHVDVPRSYVKDPSLGTFVCNQRQTYKRMNEGKGPSMDRSRIRQMNALGFKWALKHRDQPVLLDDEDSFDGGIKPAARPRAAKPKPLCWESGMAQLRDFKLLNGHTDVPHIYAANQPLGNFVKSIRQNYKNMQKGKDTKILNEQRIYELQLMGFKLQVRQREPWEQRFGELRQYVQKHGNCEVPKHTPLGIWILNQRSQFKLLLKKKPSHMSEERISLLNSIGFDWRIPMQNGMQVSSQVYVYNGRAYAPPAVSSDTSLPSDEVLAGALAFQKPAAGLASSDNLNSDTERSNVEDIQNTVPVLTSLEANTEIQPNYYQATASTIANQGIATIGFLGFGMQPIRQYAMKPAPTARSVSDDSSSYADANPSDAVSSESLATKPNYLGEVQSHSYMLPELAPLPTPALSAPIRVGNSSTVMPSLSSQADQYLAKAPAPTGLPRFTADMFVDSLLNDDANMDIGMGIPFATGEQESDEVQEGGGKDEVYSGVHSFSV